VDKTCKLLDNVSSVFFRNCIHLDSRCFINTDEWSSNWNVVLSVAKPQRYVQCSTKLLSEWLLFNAIEHFVSYAMSRTSDDSDVCFVLDQHPKLEAL